MSLLLLFLTWASALAGTLTVEVLDAGQGDAVLVTSPAGKRVLIDASTHRARVVDMLDARGITELNLVIATHAHADHIGGMDTVLERLPVKVYGDQGMSHTTRTYETVMERLESSSSKYLSLRAGRVFVLDDGIRIEILAPTNTLLRGTRSDLNSNSVVARLTHGDNCFLFTGDAEEPTEQLLIENGVGTCNVLKVAHHGSEHSTSAAWLAAVQPDLALISCGANNKYGHPAPETLERLHTAGAEVHRTDLEGTLKVTSDGRSVAFETVDESALLGPLVETGAVPPEVTRVVAASATPGAPQGDLINVNTAPAADLDLLPGIGATKAQAIVVYRTLNGPFSSLAELDAVPGIGPATLEKLNGRLRFSP